MNKIIVAILTFLLWLMPWFTPWYTALQRRTFDENVIWSKIAQCVETNDLTTIEAMMQPWIKQNIPDLPGKIGELFGKIEGDITAVVISPEKIPQVYNQGVQSAAKVFVIGTTDEQVYHLRVVYEFANVHDRHEIGIARFQLVKGTKILADIKTPQYK